MEKFQIARKEALSRIRAADHMLTQTFHLIKDPKLLISVFSNIAIGTESTMEAILHYDRAFKKIPPFHDTFSSKLHLFQNTSANLHNLGNYVAFLARINDISEKHKKSPMEFGRQDSFVICDDNYGFKTLTAKDLKKIVDEAKQFYAEAEKITKENEGIFEKRMQDE